MKSYRIRGQIIISVLILLAGVGWIWFSRLPVSTQNDHASEVPQEGFYAPDFHLTTIDGSDLSLSDLNNLSIVERYN